MEFKEFKNSTGKILKEYWLTPSEWDALDKTTVREGDIYHIVGTIDKGDLSADVNASLAKADSSLQKPTTTLAKESFVKVGIDGTQKFDENSYVIAPSTDGTAGQVLKKTATGTEWANESGGGGSGKLYLHKIVASLGRQPADIYLSIINNSITSLIEDSQLQTYIGNGITAYFYGSAGTGAVGIKFDSSKNKYSVQGAISDDSSQLVSIKFLDVFGHIADTITEL